MPVHIRAMAHTTPFWLQLAALACAVIGSAGFIVLMVVLWIVRMRGPLPPVDLFAALDDRDAVVHQRVAPRRPITREALEPSAHQPAARPPAWRVPAGPWAPQGAAVKLRWTASAMRTSQPSGKGSPER